MLKKTLVKDYMARHLVTLQPDDEIVRAILSLIEHKVSGVPVVDKNGMLVGILTEKDCLKVVVSSSYYSEYSGLVADFMSTEVEVMDAQDSIVAAAERFLKKRYHRYPVMDNNRLVGLISRTDVIRALGDYWQW